MGLSSQGLDPEPASLQSHDLCSAPYINKRLCIADEVSLNYQPIEIFQLNERLFLFLVLEETV